MPEQEKSPIPHWYQVVSGKEKTVRGDFPDWHGEVAEQSDDDLPKALFEGGWVSISEQALLALSLAGGDFRALLERHLMGDWGNLRKDEKMLNDLAVEHGEDILSSYTLPTGVEIWITTDKDRESTIIELPQEAEQRTKEKPKE